MGEPDTTPFEFNPNVACLEFDASGENLLVAKFDGPLIIQTMSEITENKLTSVPFRPKRQVHMPFSKLNPDSQHLAVFGILPFKAECPQFPPLFR